MAYSNYDGAFFEGLILTAKNNMNSIKKYKTFNLTLLQYSDLDSMSDVINRACLMIKQLNFYRYKTARKYAKNNLASKLDHFLAIDDILYNDAENLSIGIDWTVNHNSIESKVQKHIDLNAAINLVVDKTCVVSIVNENVLDSLDCACLAKAVYNLLKIINKEVLSKNFLGFIIVDAKSLI